MSGALDKVFFEPDPDNLFLSFPGEEIIIHFKI
jgi:hypothetical protein